MWVYIKLGLIYLDGTSKKKRGKKKKERKKKKRKAKVNVFGALIYMTVLHLGYIVLDGRLFQMKTVLSNNSSRTTGKSKNNLGLSFPLMTIKASVTHLLHVLMMKCNRRSNGNK